MNDTIPNVPRELLENIVLCYNEGEFELGTLAAECHAILSAQSPAGVDGLETIGYATESELAQLLDPTMPTGKYVRIGLDHPTCWKEDAPYEHLVALCVLSDAQAIIDGLRGEVEVMTQHANNYSRMFEECAEERDQQAQRIGELEGLLRHAQKQVPTGSGLHMRIDALLSAGKEGE